MLNNTIVTNKEESRYEIPLKYSIYCNTGFILKCAAESGDLDTIKYFMENGEDIHKDYILMCSSGHLDIVKYLVEQGADIHISNDFLLRSAIARGNLDVVKYIVDQGINDSKDAFICAVKSGHLDIVKYLVEQGVDMNINYAFMLCSRKQYSHIAEYLESIVNKEEK